MIYKKKVLHLIYNLNIYSFICMNFLILYSHTMYGCLFYDNHNYFLRKHMKISLYIDI